MNLSISWLANVTHLAKDLIGAPHAHLSDGCIDLLFSRTSQSNVNKGEMIKLFGLMETGEYVNHKAMEHHKVKALILDPGNSGTKLKCFVLLTSGQTKENLEP